MTAKTTLDFERRIPTRKDAFIFRGKTALLQLRRASRNVFDPEIKRISKNSELERASIIATSKTPLWTESEPEERFLLAGKIHNLRLVVKELDGIEVPTGKTFSFWKQVGRTNKVRGFVVGRELREGCIIPNIGGGLCQISNALYDAALQADFEIIERHAHTQVIPGSLAEQGRDATVFWNYVDLRFRSEKPFRIEAKLDGENLIVRFRSEKTAAKELHQIKRAVVHSDNPNSCATCEADCHRVVKPPENRNFGKTAFLVDEFMPEFDRSISENRTANDRLMVPLDGKRFKKANYAWSTSGFGRVDQSFLVTAIRSYKSRKLSAQGAARQLNLLATYEKLAESYAKKLTFDVLHVVVQQNLLPYLWKNGHLGGRTFDVLMTALPMAKLQERLDVARSLHPESLTLGDFRADESLIAAESDALKHARKIITPHSEIASLYPEKAKLIDWKTPPEPIRFAPRHGKMRIVFPASTVGRKGCHELRDALKGLDIKLVLLGPLIEGSDFWEGFDTEKGTDDWLSTADAVVLPAFVEHRPRRLILAAAAGIPVIASTACGVANVDGIKTVAPGDVQALREAIISVIATKAAV
jgi:hypothetical protein